MKRKYFAPVLVLMILIPLVTFMMYPMINMQPRDLHLGIVTLDRGETFENGEVNLGDKLIDKVTDPDSECDNNSDSPVVWKQYPSEKEARKAMREKQIYGYLLIPEDFSEKQTQTLTAFEELSSALSGMSEGTGKMGSGINSMSGKFSKIPKAFRNLSKAASGLGKAADGMKKPMDMIDDEASDIKNAADKITANDAKVQSAIGKAEEALSGDTPDVEAAMAALAEAKSTSSDSVSTINQKSSQISTQSGNVKDGLGSISGAEQAMSSNFSQMASKMSGAGNVKKLGQALTALSEGLGSASDNMDEKVTEAIDKINGDEDADEEEAAKLLFHLDHSRNIMVSTTLTQMMTGLSANAGVQVEMINENEIPEGMDNFYFSMVFMMMIMFTSMIPAILTGFTMKLEGDRKQKLRTLASQIVIAMITAICVGQLIPRAVAWMGDFDLPIETLTVFVTICSFCMMMLILGAIGLIGRPGVAVPVLLLFCGTAVANLPYEYLPAFWQKFVFPWEPLRFIAEGTREIIYRGGEAVNMYAQNMLWLIAIGSLCMILCLLKKEKPKHAVLK
ncbi:MAG: ABC transporter permease [Bacillota bacterium]|nr:ABC transporter permease [Bacillota bacterium]